MKIKGLVLQIKKPVKEGFILVLFRKGARERF
jgi:hypothetical protein